MKTERLLREAFDGDDHGFEPAPVDLIRGRVASRRRRNRGVLVAAVVALTISVGVALGPMQTPEPSAVFVSDDTGPGETETADGADGAIAVDIPAASANEAVELVDLDTTTIELLAEPAFKYRLPDVRTVVDDGEGGFIGSFFVAPVDPRGPTTILTRSDDGEDWEAFAEWDLGYRIVREIRRSGDEWMAAIDPPGLSYGVGGLSDEDNPFTNPKLEVAFSEDLETWTHRIVPVRFRDRVVAAKLSPEDTEGVEFRPIVLGAGRIDEVTAVQVYWSVSVAWTIAEDGCGTGRDDRGVYNISCDGSIDVLLDGERMRELGVMDIELYVGTNDDQLELEEGAPGWPMRATSSGFVSISSDLASALRSTDGVQWETIAQLEPPTDDEWYWGLIGDDADVGGSTVVLSGQSRFSEGHRLATVDVATGDLKMRTMPLAGVDIGVSDGFIDHGPAGWVAIVSARTSSTRGVSQGDLVAVRWPDGSRRDSTWLTVQPVVPAPLEYFQIAPTSDFVEMGLFGELRIREPGTGDVLFDDANWRAFETNRVAFTEAHELSGEMLKLDGWTVTGDPFHGPLVFTDPEGEDLVVTDGYSFTDGDFADGVELIGATADRAEDGAVAVFVDDELVWSAEFTAIVDALTVPPDPDAGADVQPGDAWLLRSDDAIEWDVVWSEEDTGFGDFPQIIVGDDEVLIRQWTVSGDVRSIPLPE